MTQKTIAVQTNFPKTEARTILARTESQEPSLIA
jgi:hypothetical protein